MAKPATEARLAAAANGFTQVIGRGNAHIITKNPATGKCCYDGQVGRGWHYGAGLETDTAWEQDAVAEYYKMVKAGYNLRARKLFNGGDLIQWTDPVSGQYVKFQPVNFQWIDGTTGSNSLISVAQAVSTPSIDDDKLYWAAAFGAGRHFRYTASPTRLIKHLIIDSASNIPACPAYITNPWLELTFTLTPSAGVIMFVDGQQWDQAATKTTASAIEFRLPSGQVVWSMAAPLAYDSSAEGIPCSGQIVLYVNKKIKYAAVRFPKAWIDTAQFPIMLDPTVDYQVVESGDDCVWFGTTFLSNDRLVYGRVNSVNYHCAARFPGVEIPDGATISVAYLSFYYSSWYGNHTSATQIFFEDGEDPSQITSIADADSRLLTSASITAPSATSGTWFNSGSIVTIIDELIASYSYATAAAMQFLIKTSGIPPDGGMRVLSSDYSNGPKLHIEYTEAAAGNPFYAYAQQ